MISKDEILRLKKVAEIIKETEESINKLMLKNEEIYREKCKAFQEQFEEYCKLLNELNIKQIKIITDFLYDNTPYTHSAIHGKPIAIRIEAGRILFICDGCVIKGGGLIDTIPTCDDKNIRNIINNFSFDIFEQKILKEIKSKMTTKYNSLCDTYQNMIYKDYIEDNQCCLLRDAEKNIIGIIKSKKTKPHEIQGIIDNIKRQNPREYNIFDLLNLLPNDCKFLNFDIDEIENIFF